MSYLCGTAHEPKYLHYGHTYDWDTYMQANERELIGTVRVLLL